jgi:mRNA-degrading endonuclease RelE of RelBE toxin-antitoxin system
VAVRPEVRTALLALAKPARRQLQHAIDGLAENPWPNDAAPLAGQPGALWLQVGRHRIVYTADTHQLLILVIDSTPSAPPPRETANA